MKKDMTLGALRFNLQALLDTRSKAIPEAARAQLRGLEVLVVNALLSRPHPLHLSIPEAVAAAREIAARRTFLTHLSRRKPSRLPSRPLLRNPARAILRLRQRSPE